MSIILSVLVRSWNHLVGSPLVRTSVNLPLKGEHMWFLWDHCLTIPWWSADLFFFFLPVMLNWIKNNANGVFVHLLSQKSFVGTLYFILRPSSMIFIHSNSHIPWVIAWSSASTLDLAITFCFLFVLVTKLPPKKFSTLL